MIWKNMKTEINNLERLFEIEKLRDQFQSECKSYYIDLFLNKSAPIKEKLPLMTLRFVTKRFATVRLLKLVIDLDVHNIHQDWDIVENMVREDGEIGTGEFIPEYTINHKLRPNIKFKLKGN